MPTDRPDKSKLTHPLETAGCDVPVKATRKLVESLSEDPERPRILFPEIHAITANHVTRNCTYYPVESLVGTPNDGTGAISFIHPYPKPVIRDHHSSPGIMGEAALPYGRIYSSTFVHTPRNDAGWLKVVGGVPDPFAIEMILTQRFLTVSIGSEVEQVTCSICGQDLVQGWCDHAKHQTYEGKLCYWKMGPIKAEEISFVNEPSDVNARVVNPTIGVNQARTVMAGAGVDTLFDLATGTEISSEAYRKEVLGVSRKLFKDILESAESYRDAYRKSRPEAEVINYTRLLTARPAVAAAMKATLKGL